LTLIRSTIDYNLAVECAVRQFQAALLANNNASADAAAAASAAAAAAKRSLLHQLAVARHAVHVSHKVVVLRRLLRRRCHAW
jgi:ribosomal protein S20